MPSPLRSKPCSARAFASVCAAAAAILSASLPAAAATTTTVPTLPSLRHLVFNFNVTVNDQTETKIEGMAASSAGGNSGGGGPGSSPDSGSRMTAGQTQKRSASSTRRGQIIVDVVAATADLGLVVDVKQESPDKSEPLTRVAITQYGVLNYDPKFELSAEEIALLHLLGRGVIGGSAYQKGDEWDIPPTGKDYTEKTTYKVVDVPSPTSEVIDETGVFQATGVHPANGIDERKNHVRPDGRGAGECDAQLASPSRHSRLLDDDRHDDRLIAG